MAGPGTHGAWLFAQGDLLVTKVNGSGATLIMTSVRAPGGEVLSIKVERLEARADALAVEATESAAEAAQRQPRHPNVRVPHRAKSFWKPASRFRGR